MPTGGIEAGVVYLDVVPNLDRFDEKLRQAARPALARMEELGRKAQDIGKKMTLGITVPVGVAATAAVKAASDLGEALNVNEKIFGANSKQIAKWADNSAKAFGQSKRAALEATAGFGGLLANLGFAADETVAWSKDLTVLASDLASAFNTDPADAVEALGSAMRGETEPIRRYNVVLDDATVRQKAVEMGLARSTSEVDRHGKAQATLALIMAQTASVQGDFAGTADGFANKSRSLRAQIEDLGAAFGEKLLPSVQKLLGIAGATIDFLGALPDPVVNAGIAVAGLTAATGPLLYAIGKTAEIMRGTFAGALSRIQGGAGTAAGALGILAIAAFEAVATLENAEASAKQFVDTVAGPEVPSTLKAMQEATVGVNRELDRWKLTMEDANVRGTNWIDVLTEQSAIHEKLEERQGALNRAMRTHQKLVERVADTYGVTNQEAQRVVDTLGLDFTQSVSDLSSIVDERIVGLFEGDFHLALLKVGNDMAHVADETDRTTIVMDDLKRQVDEILGPFLGVEQAAIRYEEALMGLQETVSEAAEADGIQSGELWGVRDALLQSTEAAVNYYLAKAEDGRITDEDIGVLIRQRGELESLRQKYPELNAVIAPHIDNIDHLVATGPVSNPISAPGAAQAASEIERVRGALDNLVDDLGLSGTFAGEGARKIIESVLQTAGRESGGRIPTRKIGEPFVTNRPTYLVGEGQGDWDEYVIPTDPKYRGRAVDLTAQLIDDLGLSGDTFEFAAGGVLSNPNSTSAVTARAASKILSDRASQFAKATEKLMKERLAQRGGGQGYQTIIDFMRRSGVAFSAISTVRPGARTRASGRVSLHALGKAVDLVGPDMYRIWEVLDRAANGWLRELIYSRAPTYVGGGSRKPIGQLNPITRADHYDHVHAGTYDEGGLLPSGQAAVNLSGMPEAVLPDGFTLDLSDRTIDRLADRLAGLLRRSGDRTYHFHETMRARDIVDELETIAYREQFA